LGSSRLAGRLHRSKIEATTDAPSVTPKVATAVAAAVQRQQALGVVPAARLPDLGKLALRSPRDAAAVQNAVNSHFFKLARVAAAECLREVRSETPFALECLVLASCQGGVTLRARVETCSAIDGAIPEGPVRCMAEALGRDQVTAMLEVAIGEFDGRVPIRLNYAAAGQ
jgi:hypothetical protein